MTNFHKKLQEVKELTKQFTKNTKHSKCFAINCNNTAISSHSISESRVLQYLSENSPDGHILFLDDFIDFDFKNVSITLFHTLRRKLKKNGKGDTSTFYGFCHLCDPEFFKKLDTQLYQNTKEINFLHAYRAFAYFIQTQNHILSFVNKKITPLQDEIKLPLNLQEITKYISTMPDNCIIAYEEVKPILENIVNENFQIQFLNNETIKTTMPENFSNPKYYPMKGLTFKNNFESYINQFTKSILSFTELATLKEKIQPFIQKNQNLSTMFFNIYKSKDYDKMLFLHIHQNFPYQITGNFVFQGAQNDLMSLTFFPEKETQKSHFIFSSITPNKNQENYFSQIKIMNNIEFQLFVSDLILRQGSNVYFSKKYWNNLNTKNQDLLILEKSERDKKLINENIFAEN